jgi:hypothetical protein
MQRQWEFAVVAAALILGLALSGAPLRAQAPSQPPAAATSQPPAAAAPSSTDADRKPYKAVAVVLPQPLKDASFEAFRNQLIEVVKRKDRAALARLVVRKGFFWEQESGDKADKKKSGIANLAESMGLDMRDDPDTGWDMIQIYAVDPTAFELPGRQGVICGPADPDFNDEDFRALLDSSQSDVSDWVYPLAAGLELHAAPSADAPVTEKLGMNFLRVLSFDVTQEATNPSAAEFVRILTPAGKVGFIKIDNIASLGVSQLCYVKEADGWKIAGVLGGIEQ